MKLLSLFRPTPAHEQAAEPKASMPHERYPELLHWREGDSLRGRLGWYYFISVTADGNVYAWDYLHRHKHKLKLRDVMGGLVNEDLRDREINEELKSSNEYMELLRQFQKAVEELRQRDIKRFGSPQ